MHMAVIRSVCTASSSLFQGGIITSVHNRNRPTSGKSSGLASLSSRACRRPLTRCPIIQRGCNRVDLERVGFGRCERSPSKCWEGWWARRIRSPAVLLGQGSHSCRAGVGGGQASAVEEEVRVMEGDVVEYTLAAGAEEVEGNLDDGRRGGVGVIVDIFKCSDVLLSQIEPLCQVGPGSKEWIQDELQPELTVPIGQLRVLQAWYSQRMVPDRISNPHGEHAEDLWILE